MATVYKIEIDICMMPEALSVLKDAGLHLAYVGGTENNRCSCFFTAGYLVFPPLPAGKENDIVALEPWFNTQAYGAQRLIRVSEWRVIV